MPVRSPVNTLSIPGASHSLSPRYAISPFTSRNGRPLHSELVPGAMPSTVQNLIYFADFVVDQRAGELRKGGLKIRLQAQPFRVLAALLESSGEVVTREASASALRVRRQS
jgi:DNA-binding response OmpR family regulator